MRISQLYARTAEQTNDAKLIELSQKIANTDKDIDIHAWLTESERARDLESQEALRKFHASAMARGGASVADGRVHVKDYAPGDVALPFLPNFSVGYPDGATYIADFVCPIVPGNVQRRYAKFSRRDSARLVDAKVSPKARPNLVSLDVANATYLEQGYALISEIANKDLADASDLPQLFAAHKRAIMFDLVRLREKRVADIFMTSSNYATNCTSDLTGNNRWDVGPASSTADPIADIRITAMAGVAVYGTPNAAACSRKVFEYLRKHPKVIAAAGARALDRVVSENELRELLGLQYLFIGDAKVDTVPGAATPTYSYLWGTGFAVFHVQPGATQEDPSFAKTFRHNPMTFVDVQSQVEGVSGITILKGSHADADQVVASDKGYLLTNCIS